MLPRETSSGSGALSSGAPSFQRPRAVDQLAQKIKLASGEPSAAAYEGLQDAGVDTMLRSSFEGPSVPPSSQGVSLGSAGRAVGARGVQQQQLPGAPADALPMIQAFVEQRVQELLRNREGWLERRFQEQRDLIPVMVEERLQLLEERISQIASVRSAMSGDGPAATTPLQQAQRLQQLPVDAADQAGSGELRFRLDEQSRELAAVRRQLGAELTVAKQRQEALSGDFQTLAERLRETKELVLLMQNHTHDLDPSVLFGEQQENGSQLHEGDGGSMEGSVRGGHTGHPAGGHHPAGPSGGGGGAAHQHALGPAAQGQPLGAYPERGFESRRGSSGYGGPSAPSGLGRGQSYGSV